MFESSRRQFLLGAISAGGAALLAPSLQAVTRISWPDGELVQGPTPLDAEWQYRQGPLDGIWEVWREEEADLWQSVSLPHCFNHADACDPDRTYYRGQGWYRITLTVANPFEGGRTILHFQGAGQTSSVWVGSTLIGTHKGGYDEFVFDITEAALAFERAKGNANAIPVVVLCDNSPDPERVPSELSDFCLYGGLYRHVNLVYLPTLALDSVHILPTVDAEGAATVSVRCRLYNPRNISSNCRMSVEVFDPEGPPVYQWTGSAVPWSNARELTSFTLGSPRLWSPETPALYRCRVAFSTGTETSSMEERFGVRQTEFIEHGPFKLNGKRVLLHGTHRHADHAGVAAAMSDDQIRQEMRLIREMGTNFIRLAHYQQDRLVLDLCDELGLMVWEETPWCRAGVGNAAFQQNAKDMLTHMIDQHFNHPSIIVWGLGNEDDWPDEYPSVNHAAIRAFMTELRDMAHEMDHSRLTAFRRCDFACDIPDVYSPSIWAGWYGGNYREYEDSLLKQRELVKRFIHIEWGADSQAGRHSEDPEAVLRRVPIGRGTEERGLAYLNKDGNVRVSKDGDWSETYACNLFDWHLKTQEKLDWLTGSAQWIFKDFASPLRADDGIPNVNQKGVVQRDLSLKESYFVFQSYWSKKPMVHLYGHSWPIRWGKIDEPRIVKAYSNCEHAELFLNGTSQGSKKRDSQDFPAAGLRWDVVFLKGPNHLRVVATTGDVSLQDEIDLTYQTEVWGAPAELRLAQAPEKDGRVRVTASLYDAANVLCLDARNQVRFSLAGAGRLIDNMGTTHASRVLQLSNGTASIAVEMVPGSTIGAHPSCVVGVTAQDLPPTFLSIRRNNYTRKLEMIRLTRRTFCYQSALCLTGAAFADAPKPNNGYALVVRTDRARIMEAAVRYLELRPRTITSFPTSRSPGGIHDYFSQADYFWPNPKDQGGKYINRDGQSNPDNFNDHRKAMIALSIQMPALTAAWVLTGDHRYSQLAGDHLRAWFVDPDTCMNPNLEYSQGVHGVSTGRSYGIIDTLHLVEVARAASIIAPTTLTATEQQALHDWFHAYLHWMKTSAKGIAERGTTNNHAVCWALQAAEFARLIDDQETREEVRTQLKTLFVAGQMALDGSFPREIARTKPYSYSIFNFDVMATLCQSLQGEGPSLYAFALPDGRGICKAAAFLYPYLKDKGTWPYTQDVEHFASLPVRSPGLLFSGLACHQQKYLQLWAKLDPDPTDPEIIRNFPIRQPLLWVNSPSRSKHSNR